MWADGWSTLVVDRHSHLQWRMTGKLWALVQDEWRRRALSQRQHPLDAVDPNYGTEWAKTIPPVQQVAEPGDLSSAQKVGDAGSNPEQGPDAAPAGTRQANVSGESGQCLTGPGTGERAAEPANPAPVPEEARLVPRHSAPTNGLRIERVSTSVPEGRMLAVYACSREDYIVATSDVRWHTTRPIARSVAKLAKGHLLDIKTVAKAGEWRDLDLFAPHLATIRRGVEAIGLEMITVGKGANAMIRIRRKDEVFA